MGGQQGEVYGQRRQMIRRRPEGESEAPRKKFNK